MMRVLVLGGSSEIAEAIVRRLAAREPCRALLAGRDAGALERAAQRLNSAGCASVHTAALEARDTSAHAAALRSAFEELGGADVVILAVGVLGPREGMPADVSEAVQVLEVNAVGAGSLLLHSAQLLLAQGSGSLVVLSSVAAERPRRANFVYGASKAALDALAQGLADSIARSRVRVLVVRPGFVRTRMTSALKEPPLAADPDAVAAAAVRGLERGSTTVWAPASLRLVMLALRMLPRPLFRRIPA